MYYILVILLLFVFAPGVYGEEYLYGHIERSNVDSQISTPAGVSSPKNITYIDWDSFYKSLYGKVVEELKKDELKASPKPLGSLTIDYSVTKDGELDYLITEDHSENLSYIVLEVFEGLKNSNCLKFPSGSQRSIIFREMTISITPVAHVWYDKDIEIIEK